MKNERPNNKEKRIAHIDHLLDRAEKGEALNKQQKQLLREYFTSSSGNVQRTETVQRLRRIADIYGYTLDSYKPIQERTGIFEKTGLVYKPTYEKVEHIEDCREGVPVFEATINGVYMFVNTVPKGPNMRGQPRPDVYEIYFPQIRYPSEHPKIHDQVLTLPDYGTIDGKMYGEHIGHRTIRALHDTQYDTDMDPETYEMLMKEALDKDKKAKEVLAQHVFEKACEIAARHVSKSIEQHAEYVYLEIEKYIYSIYRGKN